jgi:hypothetical protein
VIPLVKHEEIFGTNKSRAMSVLMLFSTRLSCNLNISKEPPCHDGSVHNFGLRNGAKLKKTVVRW